MGMPVVDMSKCDRLRPLRGRVPRSGHHGLPEGLDDLLWNDASSAPPAPTPARTAIQMGKEFELAARSKEQLKVVYRHG